MEKIVNELLKEELYYEKLENGLDVYFMPKRGFTKKYAVLATNYGSNDLEFIPIGETEPIRVNEGIAHFLEHKCLNNQMKAMLLKNSLNGEQMQMHLQTLQQQRTYSQQQRISMIV